jgi:hypothetical protein
MSFKLQCDRCGKGIDRSDKLAELEVSEKTYLGGNDFFSDMRHKEYTQHLCNNCNTLLQVFLKIDVQTP